MLQPTTTVAAVVRASPLGRVTHYDLFDFVRIVASITVIYFHSYALTGRRDPVVPLLNRTGLGYGSLAVGAFFAMSGFMIAASFERTTPSRFCLNRVARIWPGLLVVVAVSTLVLGPLLSTLSPGAYFRQGSTWSYLVHTSFLAPVLYVLPGVFSHNPYPQVVNGSLWTLPYEMLGYIGVLLVGIAGALRRRILFLPLFAATVTADVLVVDLHLVAQHSFHSLTLVDLVGLAVFFEVGVVCSLFIGFIQNHRWPVITGAALVALTGGLIRSYVLASIGVAVAVVAVGMSSSAPARRFRQLGDPSYGTYIYAFPIQQLVFWGGWAKSPLVMFAVAAPLSLVAGYFSWHLIEQPALRFAKRPGRGRRRSTEPVALPS